MERSKGHYSNQTKKFTITNTWKNWYYMHPDMMRWEVHNIANAVLLLKIFNWTWNNQIQNAE